MRIPRVSLLCPWKSSALGISDSESKAVLICFFHARTHAPFFYHEQFPVRAYFSKLYRECGEHIYGSRVVQCCRFFSIFSVYDPPISSTRPNVGNEAAGQTVSVQPDKLFQCRVKREKSVVRACFMSVKRAQKAEQRLQFFHCFNNSEQLKTSINHVTWELWE